MRMRCGKEKNEILRTGREFGFTGGIRWILNISAEVGGLALELPCLEEFRLATRRELEASSCRIARSSAGSCAGETRE